MSKRSFPLSSAVSLVSLAGALALLSGCSKQQAANPMAAMMMAPPAVRTVTAKVADVPLNVSAVGTVEAVNTVEVKSRVAGQVLRVLFSEGQNVTKGQTLFEIDPEPLHRQINQIEADIAKDKALEQQARANINRDEAQLKQTGSAEERGLALSKEGIFSKEQTDQVVANAAASRAALEADRAAVESATASLQSDRARLAQTQLQLSYTTITAPISGRAGAISIKAGNLVKENDAALVTILQLSPIYVSFGVPEQLLGEIRANERGKGLVVRASSNGAQPEEGTLRFIDNNVDSTTGTIKLKAEFHNSDQKLWPGGFVNVQAELKLERNRIIVPSRTVQTGPDGKYVWVMNQTNKTVAMRPVQVLRNLAAPAASNNEGETAVVGSGLQDGEIVVSEGQMRLAPGMKVNVL